MNPLTIKIDYFNYFCIFQYFYYYILPFVGIMIWTKDQIIELIEMLRAAPALWDIKTKEYRDRNTKFDATTKIALHFQTNVDEISRKIKSLKTQFSRERKKIEEKSKSGAGPISEDSVWFGYNMLSFMRENNISKGSRSTIEVYIYY